VQGCERPPILEVPLAVNIGQLETVTWSPTARVKLPGFADADHLRPGLLGGLEPAAPSAECPSSRPSSSPTTLQGVIGTPPDAVRIDS